MKFLFSTFVSLIIALSSLAQFSDTAGVNHYIRDSIKDRRPEKITAKQIQTVMFGLSKFLGVSEANLRAVVHDSIAKLVDSNAAHNARIIGAKTDLDSTKNHLRTEIAASAQPYKIYSAQLTQVGTADPTVSVVLNQLSGAIAWTRNGAGSYTGTLSGAFPTGKAYATYSSADNSDYQKRFYRFSNNAFFIEQRDFAGTSIDGLTIYIEIKVYN